MTAVNYDHVLDQLTAHGLLPATVKQERGGYYEGGLVVDSVSPVRCNTEDDAHEQRGWYWLSTIDLKDNANQLERYIIGAFGIWHGNDDGKTALKLDRSGRPALTAEESAAIKQRQADQAKRAKAMRADAAKEAAAKADKEWRRYVELPLVESSYLKRKAVHGFGVRYSPDGDDTLAIPMLRDGRVVGLQLIRGKDRGNRLEKQYWPSGMDKVGAFHLIGGTPRGLLLVAEGYATAASLHMATGLPVAIAFDAGSLAPVTAALGKKYRSKVLICADDDFATEGNPGIEAARLAAAAHGAQYIAPIFSGERKEKKDGTDFNDLHAKEGLHIVREQIEARLRELNWQSAPARASAGGQGEPQPTKKTLISLLSVDEACDRFALIYGGKGTLFDHQEHLLVPKTDVLDIIPDHGWREWKLREERMVVRLSEVGFDPAGTDKSIRCNLWGGWPTEPKQGACGSLLELLYYLCSGEQNSHELASWVIKWLAYPIQNPGAKMRTALIFHGPQGTGKNLFFESIMGIYGEYGRIVGQAEIEDKFNDWASRKLFLIADEVVARQELYHVKNKLKSFVTGEWIRINPKNVAAHDERNHCNVVYLSNEIQPLPLEADDRRHFVIWTPPKLSAEFYEEIRAELNSGGVAALHHHLLQVDLAGFDEHTKPPETQAKRDLMDVGAGNVQRFVRAWLGGETPHPICPCGSGDLYAAYIRWCREDGVRNPREANQFHGELTKMPGWEKGHKDRYDSLHYIGKPLRQRFILPSKEALDAAARAGFADHRKKDTQNQTQWLTDCFFAFNESLKTHP